MSTLGYQLVTGWTIDRGRSYELDKTVTGQATITTVDSKGILDPTNPSSPFNGKLNPMKQAGIALQNPVTKAWSPLFRGFVAGYKFTVQPAETQLVGEIDLVDAFDPLAATEVVPGSFGSTVPAGSEGNVYYQPQQVNDRIKAALADAGWPATQTRIFSGNVAVQGTVYPPRTQILAVMQDAADAEFPGVANLYVAKDGTVTFHGRYARFNPTFPQYGIGHWYAGDSAAANANPSTVAPISGLSFGRDKERLVNASLATPQKIQSTDIAGQLVIDSGSISSYGTRSLSFENLITDHGDELSGSLTANQETKEYAQYYVDNYAQPQNRIDSITFVSRDPSDPLASALWKLMCGVEISDLITITTTFPGGGGFNSQDFFVEGIHYQATLGNASFPNLTLTLDLSPRAYYITSPFAT